MKDNTFRRYLRSTLFSVDFLESHLIDLEDFKNLDEIDLQEKFKEICSYYKDGIKKLFRTSTGK